MKKIIDFEEYKSKKEEKNKKHNDIELFKTLISKTVKDMTDEDLKVSLGKVANIKTNDIVIRGKSSRIAADCFNRISAIEH